MKSLKSIKRFIFFIILTSSSSSFASDKIHPIFEQIDGLVTRVESGISLNAYAETLAELKINYKQAKAEGTTPDNPLLTDRMKDLLIRLDDYARAWKFLENDKYRAVKLTPEMAKKYDFSSCRISTRSVTEFYDIPCMKNIVLSDLKPYIEKAKSAHYNGW